jgi:hypothetical protein
MKDRLESSDAASELAEIERRQAGVIETVLIPRWFWWVVGLLLIPIGVAADSHERTATAVTAITIALVVAALSIWMITGRYRGARIHPATLGSAGSLYLVGFVWLVVGVSLLVAFGLRAVGVSLPATIGTVLAAVLLIVGGPMLMSRLRKVMVQNSTAAPR